MRPGEAFGRARDRAGDLVYRLRPGSRLPASRRRGLKSVALQSPAPPGVEADLAAKRDQLAHQLAVLQLDLGGLAYEMASREHFRLDVLMKSAAGLQRVDAELGQVERLLAMRETGASGSCPSCGALQSRGAVFCWQCGKVLTPPTHAPGLGAAPGPTAAPVPQPETRVPAAAEVPR